MKIYNKRKNMLKGTLECAWRTSYLCLLTNEASGAASPQLFHDDTPVNQTKKKQKNTETIDGNGD